MNLLTSTTIYLTLFSGTMITLFSSHWLFIWIGLEMSLLAIIPILVSKPNPRSIEAASKYFLIQATASMIFMMAAIINFYYTGKWSVSNTINYLSSFMLTMALSMKMGLAPFHLWVPEVTQGIPLMSGLILLTWQKIAPISIMFQIAPSINFTLIMIMALTSILLGGWGGLNQTQLRKILAYSSIAHMGWMMAIISFDPTLSILNLLVYIVLTTNMFMLLYYNKKTSTLSLSSSWNKSPLFASIILTVLMSLGGLPPLTGFSPKWMIIKELVSNNNIILPTSMAILALLNLYFYMRLIYSTSLTLFPSSNNIKLKWQFENTKISPLMSTITITSTMLLPLTPTLLSLY
uniref:NADH-ubiquinone oxidoreductase chain 2 n=1 Tax=Guerlinguetus brasiliensis TaxID=2749091 RepID=A0A7D5IVY5_9SCIU|nr:NADH dehydrogenase subunit 2 [Guerlinguetus brasiliensis]QLD21515.1 NADH dehydrogenase subunit 2 [Guerlinguetus brasiliensis]QLD21554.1 NADH dehydrogenase subunit 2 [Guerlinguetus brasiliensis]QLD21606.1 NADH dehydrogenase subunit 2 [Guerlinguetus brasiliensis]QLD21632.1 NADH dehydrogenase subunit 2 [Guerlinguetus brasiliensis]QLD21645.1 NADH dehydrogenase subunit 2 [Guerlinguetus brasiliensis]